MTTTLCVCPCTGVADLTTSRALTTKGRRHACALSTQSLNDVCFRCTLTAFIFGRCWYISIYTFCNLTLICQAVLLKFRLTLYNLPCSCKCPSLPHFYLGMLHDGIGLKLCTPTKIRTLILYTPSLGTQ